MIKAALHHLTRYRYDRPISSAPRSSGCGPRRTAARGSQLFAEDQPAQPLPQLAAGPARQLAGAGRLPRAGRSLLDRGRSARRNGGDQSVRLLRRALRRELSRSPIDATLAGDLAAYFEAEPQGPLFEALVAQSCRLSAAARSISWSSINSRLQQRIGYVIRMETGRADARRKRCKSASARAATAPGCWCSCCAGWASPRGSSPAI